MSDPATFVQLADVQLKSDGLSAYVKLTARAGGPTAQRIAAVRFDFRDGPLGFNVYREIQLAGEPTKP